MKVKIDKVEWMSPDFAARMNKYSPVGLLEIRLKNVVGFVTISDIT